MLLLALLILFISISRYSSWFFLKNLSSLINPCSFSYMFITFFLFYHHFKNSNFVRIHFKLLCYLSFLVDSPILNGVIYRLSFVALSLFIFTLIYKPDFFKNYFLSWLSSCPFSSFRYLSVVDDCVCRNSQSTQVINLFLHYCHFFRSLQTYNGSILMSVI